MTDERKEDLDKRKLEAYKDIFKYLRLGAFADENKKGDRLCKKRIGERY